MENHNFWYQAADRDRLIDFLSGIAPLEARTVSLSSLRERAESSNKLLFIWDDNPQAHPQLPKAIVGSEQLLDDLLSWTLAYALPLCPLTALVNLLSPTDLKELHSPSLDQVPRFWAPAMVGMIVSDATAGREFSPALSSCLATLTYAMCRAVSVGKRSEELVILPKAYGFASSLLSGRGVPTYTDTVAKALLTLVAISSPPKGGKSSPEATALRQISEGDLESVDLSALNPGLPADISRKLSQFSILSVEERIKVVESMSPLHLSRRTASQSVFGLAAMLALSRPATLETSALLAPYLPLYPELPIWFGLIQGVHPKSDALSSALGLRVWRELTRASELFARPSSDISIRELNVFARHPKGIELLQATSRAESSTRLLVEVTAGVTVPFRRAAPSSPNALPQSSLFPESSVSSHLRASDINEAVDAIRFALNRLSGAPSTEMLKSKAKKR